MKISLTPWWRKKSDNLSGNLWNQLFVQYSDLVHIAIKF